MKKINKNKWLDLSIFSVQITYLASIVIIATIIAIVKPVTIYVDLCIIFVVSAFAIYTCIKEVKSRRYRINELSKSVDIVLKDSLNSLDIPMAMLSSPTQIIWQNNKAKHIIPKEFIHDVALKLEKQKVKNDAFVSACDIGNGEFYSAIGNHIRFDNFDCTLVTFLNKTDEFELKDVLDNSRISIGIIFIDNYDETMQGLEEIKKAEIASMIEKELRQWVIENHGVMTKIEKDRFVFFVEKQYVDQMESESFNILERVKNISNATKLPITISIGLSYSESNLDDRYNASSSALDIALGRGGDQVVVKKDKKFDFYGGSNIGLEKTSRVRARTIAQALKELMQKSDKVYIMGHKNTDIDCIGAAIGVYKIAKSLDKEVYIVVDSKCNNSTKGVIDKIKVQEEYDDVFINQSDLKKQDTTNALLIVVDTHKKSYVAYPDFVDEFEKIIVIDHHRRGPEFIENALLTYHEIYASSASELVTELLIYLEDIELSSIEAECLYAGIVVDTKNFMFKTGVRTFEVAAYLKRYGIDFAEVKQLFQSDFETYVARVEIVKNAEIIKDQIAVSVANDEYDDMPIIAAQAADELLSISGILASFVLCKVDDVVMISGRSMGDINVQAILETVGGGGHLTFAGAQIAGITLEEAKQKLLASIDEYYGKE